MPRQDIPVLPPKHMQAPIYNKAFVLWRVHCLPCLRLLLLLLALSISIPEALCPSPVQPSVDHVLGRCLRVGVCSPSFLCVWVAGSLWGRAPPLVVGGPCGGWVLPLPLGGGGWGLGGVWVPPPPRWGRGWGLGGGRVPPRCGRGGVRGGFCLFVRLFLFLFFFFCWCFGAPSCGPTPYTTVWLGRGQFSVCFLQFQRSALQHISKCPFPRV